MKKVVLLIEVLDDVTDEAVCEEVEFALRVMEDEGQGSFPVMVHSVSLPGEAML